MFNLSLQISCDFGELREGGLEIFDNFLSDDVGIGEIRAVFQAFVFEPKDVEVEFIALDQLFVGETLEALGFFSLMAISAVAASL